jgi:broad specificity phosphatase PhoE
MTASDALWPRRLLLVRHAESMGNVARNRAEAGGEALIDIAQRDMDVPLSPTGREQAARLGESFDPGDLPSVIYTSPYIRAAETARIACEAADLSCAIVADERLREREFGVLDRLTRHGIELRFPHEAEARQRVGKFYYRPPGGESWCDVALRIRSFVDTMSREQPDAHVVVFAHEVVVYMFRYVLERLGEHDVLALSDGRELANCSRTEYRLRTEETPSRLELVTFDSLPADVALTLEPDVPRAPR